MKAITKDGKFFGRISVLDIIIICAAAFLVVVFVLSATKNISLPAITKSSIDYTAKFKAYSVEKCARSPFNVGDKIYSYNEEYIGEIVSVEVQPLVVKSKLQDGTLFDFERPDYDDYIITVKGSGSYSDNGYAASGTFSLFPNNSVGITSRYFSGSAVVLSVEKTA